LLPELRHPIGGQQLAHREDADSYKLLEHVFAGRNPKVFVLVNAGESVWKTPEVPACAQGLLAGFVSAFAIPSGVRAGIRKVVYRRIVMGCALK
ncbi:hypothetical protein, partial [Streptomyces sp. SID5770]|uniref:hypothetical protein n=1 Tax=Streptomyces sp. SID5770 TaxID=2690308 RepID=UPI001F3B0F68